MKQKHRYSPPSVNAPLAVLALENFVASTSIREIISAGQPFQGEYEFEESFNSIWYD